VANSVKELVRKPPTPSLTVAVDHRPGGDHLGIDQGTARQQAMEEPAMPVGPFHHRGDAKAPF